ncbi:hypothetical protein AB0L99_24945 [Streptomyces sp. NPDC051954]|uniref:hypothetical protein n=1 Tax=Streptomyces sp. NPDC051954 TaxID=3155524 RepID=UPI003435782A
MRPSGRTLALRTPSIEQLTQAIEDARPDTTPTLIPLHSVTANVLRIKVDWSHTPGR